MKEQDLQLTVPDGTVDAVLITTKDGQDSFPGVLFCTDIGGIRDTMREMGRRLAAEGYTVLMPNLFYRVSRPPVFSFPRKPGDPATMKRIGELSAPLTPGGSGEGPSRLSRHLGLPNLSERRQDRGGWVVCIGGGIALRSAAIRPERVGAVASFHGGGPTKPDNPSSPHLVLPKVQAQHFGHATEDKSMDAEAITRFTAALKEWGGVFESEVYEARGMGGRFRITLPT